MDIYIRKTGNDSNDGLTKYTAIASMQKAFSIAKVGCRIIIGSGYYTWISYASPPDNTSIIGDTTGALAGDAGKIILNDVYTGHGFYAWSCKNIELKNIIFKKASGYYGLWNVLPWTIKNCVMDLGNGISTTSSFYNCTLIGHSYFSNFFGTPKAVENCIILRQNNEVTLSKNNYVNNNAYADLIFDDVSNGDYHVSKAYVNSVKSKGILNENISQKDMLGYPWQGNPWYGALGPGAVLRHHLYLDSQNTIYGMQST